MTVAHLNPSTVETQAPRVVVCNHQSALDMMWMASIIAPAALTFGKRQLVYVPFVNLAWWVLGFVLVDRENPSRAAAVLEGAADLIVRGRRSLIVAPEGTRSRDGEFLPFKRGAFLIAVRAQVPIHPVVVSNAHELCPRGSWLPRPGVVRLRFLPPVETRGLSEADARGLMERVRADMLAAYEGDRPRRS